MLVFSTKIPLKSDVTQETCLRLFVDWVTRSPNYPIDSIPYDFSSREDYKIESENITFSIGHYRDDGVELTACRLENRETRAIWYNDCIFLSEPDGKTLLIQLNCDRLDFDAQLPRIHKPYIVRLFVESGYCRNDAGLPVCAEPVPVTDGNFETCARVMRCECGNVMPVVYVSRDLYWDPIFGAQYIARHLGGVAHVLLETDRDTALRLRAVTDGRNAHNGYIGVYFPNSPYYRLFRLSDFSDYHRMGTEVIHSVWQALINRIDSSKYNWNQIKALQARQKMREWESISAHDQQSLQNFVDTFDSENRELRDKLDVLSLQNADLSRQIAGLRAQNESLREAMQAGRGSRGDGVLSPGAEKEFYPGELNDLLVSILGQLQGRFEPGSRPECLIGSLLAANPPAGECRRILDALKVVFSGDGRLNSAGKSTLASLGFTLEEDGGTHYKLTFHDPRYLFSVAKTPSDHRGGKNLYSEISRMIDVNKKII
jgi:hypothetical protein